MSRGMESKKIKREQRVSLNHHKSSTVSGRKMLASCKIREVSSDAVSSSKIDMSQGAP